jgi:hypothetical protein
MKITIKHDQSSIDPNTTYSDEQFESVIDSLEREYESEIRKSYPEAEIEFERGDYCGAGIIVTDTGLDDPSDDQDEIQRICELVYETGNFWV